MDDDRLEDDVTGDELAAAQRALAELGQVPLPPAVAERLDARLAAELDASPLSQRRSRRRRVRVGGSITAVAAVAAAIVFAFGTGGGGHTPGKEAASGVRETTASVMADATTTATIESTDQLEIQAPAAKKACPSTRKAGARPTAACPGARGGHARSV